MEGLTFRVYSTHLLLDPGWEFRDCVFEPRLEGLTIHPMIDSRDYVVCFEFFLTPDSCEEAAGFLHNKNHVSV